MNEIRVLAAVIVSESLDPVKALLEVVHENVDPGKVLITPYYLVDKAKLDDPEYDIQVTNTIREQLNGLTKGFNDAIAHYGSLKAYLDSGKK